MKKVKILLMGIAICTFTITSCNIEKSKNTSSHNSEEYKEYEESDNKDPYSSYSYNDYKKEKEKEKPNHPKWCIGSWRVLIDDVNVMIASIYGSKVDIKIMHGLFVADSETLENWTVEDGMLYMYNGTNKYGSYHFTADELNKVLYHKGRAMEKH